MEKQTIDSFVDLIDLLLNLDYDEGIIYEIAEEVDELETKIEDFVIEQKAENELTLFDRMLESKKQKLNWSQRKVDKSEQLLITPEECKQKKNWFIILKSDIKYLRKTDELRKLVLVKAAYRSLKRGC
ncbi:hypothetical protein QYM36_016045 [Artemia franciscana]|uniref:Uncharacterized protein n=1 Tax=Artemia franciscana TaxID=6661 RepID=A0AA88KTC5_ARTSF|nr:hypothetical protein QYM36_016045 [Artemia franciscana]